MIKEVKMANALQSLFGDGHREQTILTPPCIIEALHTLWSEGIALDPCAAACAADNIPATKHYVYPDQDGLVLPWADKTYCNPPYGDLKKWLVKSATEDVEHVMLVPVRTHREWFQLANYDAVSFLRPLAFVGHKQAFPAPLCALYNAGNSYTQRWCYGDAPWESVISDRLDAFASAFDHLSTQTIYL